MKSISSLVFNQDVAGNMKCLSLDMAYRCLRDSVPYEGFMEEEKSSLEEVHRTNHSSPQIAVLSSGLKAISLSQLGLKDNVLGQRDVKKLLSEKIEAFNKELIAFAAVALKRKVSELIAKDSQKTNDKPSTEAKALHFGMINEREDVFNKELLQLIQLKAMEEKFLSSPHCLALLLENSLETFFNKENSVEPSFEKEINDIMSITPQANNAKCSLRELLQVNQLQTELKHNSNTNHSTPHSIPSGASNKLLTDQYEMNQEGQHFALISPSQSHRESACALDRERDQQEELLLSSIMNNNNNNMCSLDTSNSSIEFASPNEKTPSKGKPHQGDESSGTKRTRREIEELIMKRTVRKFDDYHSRGRAPPKKYEIECSACHKTFTARADQTWRTRCYFCQMEFKKSCPESKKTDFEDKASFNKHNLHGRTKQVCVDCKSIFVVPVAFARQRKRCYTCYREYCANKE